MIKRLPRHLNEFSIALAAMGACFLYLLSRTWMKWGDLIVDTFREFWVPMKLLEGHVLYRDIFYEYGFFPPYLQAILFKIFGVHLYTLAGLGIVTTLLIAAAVYLIPRMFLSATVSALTVIVFFLVFAFGYYADNNNFNAILPYSFASTLFLLFILYALYFFLRFLQSGQNRFLGLWAFFMSMAMFCRIEIPILAWGGFFVTGLVYIFNNSGKKNIPIWLLLLLPPLLTAAGYLLFIAVSGSWAGFRESVINPLLYLKSDHFQDAVMGTADTVSSLKIIAGSTALTLVLLPLLGAAASGITSRSKSAATPTRLPALTSGLLVIALVMIYSPDLLACYQYRCLSLFLPGGILYFAWKSIKTKDPVCLQLFCLCLTALIVASRMLLNMGPELYGFYLLVPGLIVYHLIIFRGVVPRIIRVFPSTAKPFLEVVLACFLLVLAFDYWGWSVRHYDSRTLKTVSDHGTFYWVDDHQTRDIMTTVDYLSRNTSPEQSVVVFPEGIAVNLLADRKNPLRYCNFMPPVLQYIGEETIIKGLSDSGADYVVVISRDASDYGYPFFGVHYARDLYGWIRQNYRLERVIGAMPFESTQFGVAIYRKGRP
ncbi:MAG: hypothetical protein AB1724_03810 [Thermodesulfobacteriota bacterium]